MSAKKQKICTAIVQICKVWMILKDMLFKKIMTPKAAKKCPKSGLKISQLGKYFFATGKIFQPSCEKISPQLGIFCNLKNLYNLE